MKVGIPKECKDQEYRVGGTPAMVRALVEAGHSVCIQEGAGAAIGLTDQQYQEAGAVTVSSLEEVYLADMVVKVKEPQEKEFPLLRKGLILFCYLHLAADPPLARALLDHEVTAIAYETVTDPDESLPLLIPMSEIAGRIAIQVGAASLQMTHGGKGVLLGGVPGVIPARVTIIGGGIVGTESARMAMGLGANVTLLDRNLERLRELDHLFGPKLKTLFSTSASLEEAICRADLVIGAILIPGKKTPMLITEKLIRGMTPGSVFVDVAIDQGGCSETSHPTTHSDPIYVKHDIVHYCVTNMPGACAVTSTWALTNATTAYVLELANLGWRPALKKNSSLLRGLNVYQDHVTNKAVAEDLGYPYMPPGEVL